MNSARARATLVTVASGSRRWDQSASIRSDPIRSDAISRPADRWRANWRPNSSGSQREWRRRRRPEELSHRPNERTGTAPLISGPQASERARARAGERAAGAEQAIQLASKRKPAAGPLRRRRRRSSELVGAYIHVINFLFGAAKTTTADTRALNLASVSPLFAARLGAETVALMHARPEPSRLEPSRAEPTGAKNQYQSVIECARVALAFEYSRPAAAAGCAAARRNSAPLLASLMGG